MLKLIAGVSRKLGLPHYGSLGATCQVEVELNHALCETDPAAFLERVGSVHAACARAVAEALARHRRETMDAADRVSRPGPVATEDTQPSERTDRGKDPPHTRRELCHAAPSLPPTQRLKTEGVASDAAKADPSCGRPATGPNHQVTARLTAMWQALVRGDLDPKELVGGPTR